MKVLHLTSSRFFGGPERQMLELAIELKPNCQTTIASFSEGGRCREFLRRARENGIDAVSVPADTPRLFAAKRDVIGLLRETAADVLICHGYKAGIIGLLAARACGVAVIAVSRGWTAESARVRMYEAIDRRVLCRMDHVVCVSRGQAAKVARAGVSPTRMSVIHNAVRCERFSQTSRDHRRELEALFPVPPRLLVGAAGRLSPEKGFEVLIEAAVKVLRGCPRVGFVVFGDGPLRSLLEKQVAKSGLCNRFVMPGFRDDLDELLPGLDLFCSSSFTEGLPNVILEAHAAGVPVVATAVGGTPEVVLDAETGLLVPSGRPEMLAACVTELLSDELLRRRMSAASRAHVRESFSFPSQAASYQQLFDSILTRSPRRDAVA